MAEKPKEVLPGYVAPFTAREQHVTGLWFVCDSNRFTVSLALIQDQAEALARILNSHGQCVEALKKIEGGCFDTPEGDDESFVVAHQQCARAALSLTQSSAHASGGGE